MMQMHDNVALYGVKDTHGKIFVSSKLLIYLMTMHVWQMTEHYKVTYGHKICIYVKSLHASLLVWGKNDQWIQDNSGTNFKHMFRASKIYI